MQKEATLESIYIYVYMLRINLIGEVILMHNFHIIKMRNKFFKDCFLLKYLEKMNVI